MSAEVSLKVSIIVSIADILSSITLSDICWEELATLLVNEPSLDSYISTLDSSFAFPAFPFEEYFAK